MFRWHVQDDDILREPLIRSKYFYEDSLPIHVPDEDRPGLAKIYIVLW